ncbi:UNVERIFIED_CONTAM: hypothetical protein FKN15_030068 [Acipenser sinensis]
MEVRKQINDIFVAYGFLLQCLEDLDASLRKLNSHLFVIHGQPADVFPSLFKVLTQKVYPQLFGQVEKQKHLQRERSEFTFFLDTVSSVSTPGMKNLLVWGRKCWEAFPESLLPLPNTMHVVLSRTLRQVISVPKHAQYLCSDLQGSVKLGSTHPLCEVIETIWIIGGVEPYIEALQHPWCDLVYLTDVQADFECDTYFPEFNNNVYKLVDESTLLDALDAPTVLEREREPAKAKKT